MKLTDVEASFFRYLYENLEVTDGIKVLEDINLQDFSGMVRWVVVDSLSNRLGPQPVQLYFLHIAVQKQGALAKAALVELVNKVVEVIDEGTSITVYDYATGLEIGEMEVSETSLSPVMPHFSGGTFRSMTVGVVYAA
jgi:hypothetical protein